MALDDFLDDDSSTDTEKVVEDEINYDDKDNNNEVEDSNWNQKDKSGEFYKRSYKQTKDGNVVPRGPIGYETQDNWEEQQVDSFVTTELNPKFWYAVYPHITSGDKWDIGDRFQLKLKKSGEEKGVWRIRSITCISTVERALHTIPREAVMLDTNSVTKQDALDTLSERFGHEVEPSDTVHMHILGDWMAMAAGAIAGHNLNRVTKSELDELRNAYVWPMSVKKIGEPYDDKGWTNMMEW